MPSASSYKDYLLNRVIFGGDLSASTWINEDSVNSKLILQLSNTPYQEAELFGGGTSRAVVLRAKETDSNIVAMPLDRTQGAISTAITALSNNGTVTLPAGEYPVSGTLTVPAGITLQFQKGAILNIGGSSGDKADIKGPVNAGEWQIFSFDSATNGYVYFGETETVGTSYANTPTSPIRDVYAAWFGCVGDNSTDNATPMKKLFLCSNLGTRFIFSRGVYKTTGKNYFSTNETGSLRTGLANLEIVGNNPTGTVILYTGTTSATSGIIHIQANCMNFHIENLHLNCNSKLANAIKCVPDDDDPLRVITYFSVSHCWLTDYTETAIRVGDYSDTTNDLNAFSYSYNEIHTRGNDGTTDYIIDAPNAVDHQWRHCSYGNNSNASQTADCRVHIKWGHGMSIVGGYAAHVDGVDTGSAKYLFKAEHNASLQITGLTAEDYRLLSTDSSDSTSRPRVAIDGFKVTLLTGPTDSTPYSIYAPYGSISLKSCDFQFAPSSVRPRQIEVSDVLHTDNCTLGDNTCEYILDNPERCTINGIRLNSELKFLTPNPRFDWWIDSDAAPAGWSANDATVAVGKSTYYRDSGAYTAHVTITAAPAAGDNRAIGLATEIDPSRFRSRDIGVVVRGRCISLSTSPAVTNLYFKARGNNWQDQTITSSGAVPVTAGEDFWYVHRLSISETSVEDIHRVYFVFGVATTGGSAEFYLQQLGIISIDPLEWEAEAKALARWGRGDPKTEILGCGINLLWSLPATLTYANSNGVLYPYNKIVQLQGTSAPDKGRYRRGDQILYYQPSAGSKIGAICTSSASLSAVSHAQGDGNGILVTSGYYESDGGDAAEGDYIVEIETGSGTAINTATFKWSSDNGVSWTTGTLTSDEAIYLNHGVEIRWRDNGDPDFNDSASPDRWTFSGTNFTLKEFGAIDA